MNLKVVLLAYALVLFVSCVGITFQIINPVRATTWTVDDDGPADFQGNPGG